MSPRVFQEGPYRFYFFASDQAEPLHVHVARDNKEAKFWLETLTISYNKGFPDHEISKIKLIIKNRSQEIKDKWNEFFAE